MFEHVCQQVPCASAVNIGHHVGQLDVAALQHFLETVQFAGSFFYEALGCPFGADTSSIIKVHDDPQGGLVGVHVAPQAPLRTFVVLKFGRYREISLLIE